MTALTPRSIVTLVLGVIMFALGAYVAVRPLWSHNSTLTGPRWLDIAFAVVFMLRGAINVRTVRNRSRGGGGGAVVP